MAERKRNGLLFDEVLPRAKRTAQSLLSLDPQEDVPASQQALEMALGFVPGIGQAMALRDIERARRAEDPTAGALAAASLVPFGRLLGKGRSAGPIMSELDVYHGTPHRFPATEANPLGEFDASKIGTGEGAQAYGHGVYYAENPEVAKGYQPRDPKAEAKLMNLYKQAEARENYDAMEVLEAAMLHRTASELREQYPNQKALVNRIGKINEKAAGALYKADLPDEMIDRMLNWDKPLIEQKSVLKALTEMANRDRTGASAVAARTARSILQRAGQAADSYGKDKVTGASLYDSFLADEIPDQAQRSQFLKDLGIPGIRYLDAGSRGQSGSGTRNFVVFPGEEKKVKILERK